MIYLLIAFIVCIILFILYAVLMYNGLVLLKHNISKAWANIDVLLKQRNSEISKLIDVCKEYMSYESETLNKIILARNHAERACEQANIIKVGETETALRKNVKQLFILSEQYPELKAIERYNYLTNRISTLETHLADRRELYNASVNLNNTRIEQFPYNIFADLFEFKKVSLLEFE